MSDSQQDKQGSPPAEPSISLAPNRLITGEGVRAVTPQPWTPPAPTMARMQHDGQEVPEYVAPEPAPSSHRTMAPMRCNGQEQTQGAQQTEVEQAYWEMLDEQDARSRADYEGMAKDQRRNGRMTKVYRMWEANGGRPISALEMEQPPARLLRVPPPVDRRRGGHSG